jgi:hypothetical protein
MPYNMSGFLQEILLRSLFDNKTFRTCYTRPTALVPFFAMRERVAYSIIYAWGPAVTAKNSGAATLRSTIRPLSIPNCTAKCVSL